MVDNGLGANLLSKCGSAVIFIYMPFYFLRCVVKVTADLNGGCTDRHTGTSVAPPMVAGVVALALEVK